MANNTLNTRLVICNDTTANWGTSEKVLLKGEYAIEFPESGEPKVKVGNGTDKYVDLPYITNTPTEITNAINAAVKTASHTHSNKAILDAITASFTTELKANYDKAYTHSQSAHAPSNAQANVIETVKVNGTALTPNSKAVDVKVPTKVSELTNDKNYISSYKDTTYTLGTPVSATNGNATVDLVDSSSKKQSVTIKGSGATSVTTDANGVIVVNSTDTKYSHPTSGVSAGTYTKVNVNAQGHVTGGSNPTTLGGYGITDAAAKQHTHGNADITAIDAGKITTGTIDIARLPQGALERLTIVADDTARFKLTKDKVQLGDTVKVTGTGLMYYVVDESKLSSGEGYEVYTAGSATSVPWSGVTGKPSSYTPSTHNQAISTITGLQAALDGKSDSSHTHDQIVNGSYGASMSSDGYVLPVGNVWIGKQEKPWDTAYIKNVHGTADRAIEVVDYNDINKGIKIGFAGDGFTSSDFKYALGMNDERKIKDVSQDEYRKWLGLGSAAYTSSGAYATASHSHTKAEIADFPTSMPASDVPAWAKASSKPTYTKSEVGLGNVDNTADAAKSVKYATSAGSATSATTASKLGTNAGSTTHPVYFSNGVPVACNVSTDVFSQGSNTLVLDGGSSV